MHLPSDESLQSFIFRQTAIYGSSNFSSVIDDDGTWLCKPIVPQKEQYIFRRFNENSLLSIAQNSGLAVEADCLFGNPTSHIIALSEIFAGSTQQKIKNKGIQVAYCDSCIKESINERGFGYFKASWLMNSHCIEHYKRLLILNKGRKKDTVEAIVALMLGNSIKDASYYRKHYEKGSYSILNFRKTQTHPTHTHYMPCVLPAILYLIKDNMDLLVNNSFIRKRYWLRNLTNSGILYPHDLHKICLEIANELPNLFNTFLQNSVTRKLISFGVWNKEAFSTYIYKSNENKCSDCVKYASLGICPINFSLSAQNNHEIGNEFLNIGEVNYVHLVEKGTCKVNFKG